MATTDTPDRDAEILGRDDVDDLEAILSVSNTDVDEAIHAVRDNADAIFTWDYEKGARPSLEKLYEKAKNSMWNGTTDLPWETPVDQEEFARRMMEMRISMRADMGIDLTGTVFERWGEKEWMDLSIQTQNWSLSQFMHGEQGALLCTAKIVETVPWIDAKYYAATQVMDEARHVEVFARYLDTKLSGHYPINAHLKMLLDDIIEDSRWDMTYLGMQVMVEGLALAAFGMAFQTTPCPLLKQLLRYVMSDEARHVAFGVLSLKEYYAELTEAELLERQEFAFEAAVRMRDRFLQQEVWDRMGVSTKDALQVFNVTPEQKNEDPFQQLLFSKIVPNCKKLGLLDANDGWLRKRFDTLGVTQFESWVDTGEEYELLDEVSKDRAAAEAETA
ncbi:MAG TPA: ferritin-like domain-containing protein [Acidimicrobiales bacterium]|nr:ferritin-like domain-containing protein [Acidimicrobiales bacterium]